MLASLMFAVSSTPTRTTRFCYASFPMSRGTTLGGPCVSAVGLDNGVVRHQGMGDLRATARVSPYTPLLPPFSTVFIPGGAPKGLLVLTRKNRGFIGATACVATARRSEERRV